MFKSTNVILPSLFSFKGALAIPGPFAFFIDFTVFVTQYTKKIHLGV